MRMHTFYTTCNLQHDYKLQVASYSTHAPFVIHTHDSEFEISFTILCALQFYVSNVYIFSFSSIVSILNFVNKKNNRGGKTKTLTEISETGMWPKIKRCFVSCCRCIAENNVFNGFVMCLIIYALIGDDLRLAFTSYKADNMFELITWGLIGVFGFEVIVNTFGKEDYFRSFFFWLDIIATATLVLDLPCIAEDAFSSEPDLAMESVATDAEASSGSGANTGAV